MRLTSVFSHVIGYPDVGEGTVGRMPQKDRGEGAAVHGPFDDEAGIGCALGDVLFDLKPRGSQLRGQAHLGAVCPSGRSFVQDDHLRAGR